MAKKTMILKLKIIATIGLVLLSGQRIFSQELMTLKDAIETGLKNNYSVAMGNNLLSIAKNNNSISNSGFLPTLGASFSQTNNNNNTYQKYYTGIEREAKNAGSNSMNAAVVLNWTIFDGGNMFINKHSLAAIEQLNVNNQRMLVESTVYQIILAYYSIVLNKQYLDVLKLQLELSGERKHFAEARFRLGAFSQMEVIQSDVYLNADSSAYLKQLGIVRKAMGQLNQLLSRPPETDFIVDTAFKLNPELDYNRLLQGALSQNTELIAARKKLDLARLELQSSKSEMYPKISLFGGYNSLFSESEVGILQKNQTSGFNYGISANFNLFSGYHTQLNVRNNKLLMENSQLALKESELAVKNDIYKSYLDYQTYLNLVKLEEQNLLAAQTNYTFSAEAYKLGKLTGLELREKQKEMLEAQFRLFNANYQCKIAEVTLLLYAGELVK